VCIGYRIVATRGSIIYFVVANLSLVDPMYQFSLQYYKDLVNQRLAKTEKLDVLEDRLNLLIDDITKSIYVNVCRGLFEKDKLLYSFITAVNIELNAGYFSHKHWQLFLVGVIPNQALLKKFPIPDGLKMRGCSEKVWANMVLLENSVPEFQGGN
jgi:dynein heavy chain